MMEQREGYKKTKIGWIPEEWDTKRIDEIAEVLLSNVDKKSSTNEINVLLCNYMDVFHNDYIASSMPFMKATATLQEIEKFSLIKNDVLLTKDSETQEDIAQSAVVSEELEGVLCGYHLAILRPYQNQIAGRFLMNTIKSPAVHNYFVKLTNGVTRFGLNKASINEAHIPFPPLPEQKKIASILTTVDDKISSIDQQIQQTEQLKKGLMEKLLTEGIGHTEFKETKIGRIPKGWDVERLGEKCDVRDGTHYSPKYHDTGVPFITSKNLKPWGVDFTDIKYISEEDHIDFSKRSHVENGDILFGMIGTVGNPVIVQADFEFSIKNVALIKLVNNSAVNNQFLLTIFNSSIVDRQFRKISNGGVLSFVALGAIRNLFIPLPPFEEQKQIATILSTVDDKIDILTQKKTQYKTLKKGLSQQLLTGQMRVKI